jgi:hypothetical protein
MDGVIGRYSFEQHTAVAAPLGYAGAAGPGMAGTVEQGSVVRTRSSMRVK